MNASRTPDRRPTIGHLPGLDGLRGAAVVAVVAYHLRLVPGGFVGVDVFFVLSGFLVTSLLLNELASRRTLDLVAFWGRRIRRLVPAVLVMVPVALGAALVVGWPPTRLGATAVDAIATLTWWANWRQASGTSYWDTGDPSLFRHAWSLSIEEQFYLAWPLVVAGTVVVAGRLGRSVRAAVGVVAATGFVASSVWAVVLSHRLGDLDLSRAYVGTDTRVLAPLAGCALACWWRRPSADGSRAGTAGPVPRWTAMALAVAALAVLAAVLLLVHVDDPLYYRAGGFSAVAVASVVLVRAAADGHAGWVLRWASAPTLRYLGLRSYGLYLWSWPIQVIVERQHPGAPRWAVVTAVVAASLVTAEASHRMVEEPMRRNRSWAVRPTVRRTAWALGLALPVVALVATLGVAEDPPDHERIDTEASVSDALDRPPPTMSPEEESAHGEGDPEPMRVMVIGDSVAFTVGLKIPRRDDMPPGVGTIDGRGIIGCGQLAAEGWEYPWGEGGRFVLSDENCMRQPEVEQRGLDGRPDVVMSMPGAWEFTAARSPSGQVVAAQSPEMADLLVDSLVGDARRAHEVGASFVLVEWACPGAEAEAGRRDPEFTSWMNQVMADAAETARSEHGIDAWVMAPSDQVCIDGDPTGEPTAAKDEATRNEVHIHDEAGGHWIWHQWFGPALTSRP